MNADERRWETCAHEWVDGTSRATGQSYGANEHSTVQHGTCEKCGAWRGAYGLEPTVEMYVAHTVAILREVRRVLRDDGVCFWNIGDAYAHGKPGGGSVFDNGRTDGRTAYEADKARGREKVATLSPGLKPKDLCLIPARVALAAQADGWWVRSLIVWAKPNPMPESVTDRPTDAYEFVLMLTRSATYFWDAEAVKEAAEWPEDRARVQFSPRRAVAAGKTPSGNESGKEYLRPSSRNLRNVWTFATQPYSGAHFATFPEELPRRCILAATSAKGACAQCGAPWERVTRRVEGADQEWAQSHNPTAKMTALLGQRSLQSSKLNRGSKEDYYANCAKENTIGWRPTCKCRGQRGVTVPCVVLDPFGGSGTTGRVALELNRRAMLVDLAYAGSAETDKADYAELADRRTSHVQRQLVGL